MRGAFGKPQGTVARVHIGQIIMSVRAKDNHKEKVVEALRRAKFKYPGRQKVCIFVINCKTRHSCITKIVVSNLCHLLSEAFVTVFILLLQFGY